MPAFHGCRVTRRNLHAPATEFDLTVSLEENSNGSIEMALEYATTAISDSSASRLGSAYSVLLRHALSAPGSPLSALQTLASEPLTSTAENRLLQLCEEALGRRLSVDDHWAALDLSEAKRKVLLNALRHALPQLQYRELRNAGTLGALACLSRNSLE